MYRRTCPEELAERVAAVDRLLGEKPRGSNRRRIAGPARRCPRLETRATMRGRAAGDPLGPAFLFGRGEPPGRQRKALRTPVFAAANRCELAEPRGPGECHHNGRRPARTAAMAVNKAAFERDRRFDSHPAPSPLSSPASVCSASQTWTGTQGSRGPSPQRRVARWAVGPGLPAARLAGCRARTDREHSRGARRLCDRRCGYEATCDGDTCGHASSRGRAFRSTYCLLGAGS